jgi:hypothetical protein
MVVSDCFGESTVHLTATAAPLPERAQFSVGLLAYAKNRLRIASAQFPVEGLPE